MAFYSNLYGREVIKAAKMMAHPGAGTMLTFDSYDKFPTYEDLQKDNILVGYLHDDNRDGSGPGIPQYFNFCDTSTKNIYIDASANMMYRWKQFTKEEWGAEYWDVDDEGNPVPPDSMKNPADDPISYGGTDTEEYKKALEKYNEWLSIKYPEETNGYAYVACAGGGGSDLYWTKI